MEGVRRIPDSQRNPWELRVLKQEARCESAKERRSVERAQERG